MTNKTAQTFEDIKKFTILKNGFHECSEKLYFEALGAVPPIYLPNGTWQMGEAYSGSIYYTFFEKNGKYYSCLCNANYSIANIVPDAVLLSEKNQVIYNTPQRFFNLKIDK